jgi:uncharacterized membrane protein HdeD (DUF308 family)
MATDSARGDDVGAAVAGIMKLHWKAFLIEGILLLLLGVTAIVAPPLATITVELTVGWVILFSGVAGLIATFRTRGTPGFGWALLSAVIGITTGMLLLIWPVSGVLTLTLIVSTFLAIEGVASIMYALAHRREKTRRWGFVLFSGITDLILSAMIFWGFPATAGWVIGLIVGINLMFGGTALIAMALRSREEAALNKVSMSG